MHDGKALQAGTSHFFGDGFARAFNIQFTDKDNTRKFPFQTSWGVSTRLIGGIIMTHGDNNGLVLPPAVAPVQIIIVPIAQHKEGVLEACRALRDRLKGSFRVKLDESENSAGWKFAQYEMKGVPLRIELGPRDIEAGQCVMVTRHNGEKHIVSLESIESSAAEMLKNVHDGLYEKALANREHRTYACKTPDEINAALAEKGDGFVKTMWCGSPECEAKMKELCGITSRCIPFDQTPVGDRCICCGKPANTVLYWGKAY